MCKIKNINLVILYTNLHIERYEDDQKNFVPVYLDNSNGKSYQLFANQLQKFL